MCRKYLVKISEFGSGCLRFLGPQEPLHHQVNHLYPPTAPHHHHLLLQQPLAPRAHHPWCGGLARLCLLPGQARSGPPGPAHQLPEGEAHVSRAAAGKREYRHTGGLNAAAQAPGLVTQVKEEILRRCSETNFIHITVDTQSGEGTDSRKAAFKQKSYEIEQSSLKS